MATAEFSKFDVGSKCQFKTVSLLAIMCTGNRKPECPPTMAVIQWSIFNTEATYQTLNIQEANSPSV